MNGITVNDDGSWSADGEEAVNLVRMLTIRSGIRLETKGLKMTRGRSCTAIATEILQSEGIIKPGKRPQARTVYPLFDKWLADHGVESKPLS